MRILSARIIEAQRLRDTDEVLARVMLIARFEGQAMPTIARVDVRSPAHAPDAAPLRERLLAGAKLAFVAGRADENRRAA